MQATPVTAIVDSAAEVTIISDKVYNKLKPKPPVKKHAILHTAGRGMSMKGFIVGPVNVQLGSLTFEEDLYVAPIQDEMLLGIDILQERKINIETSKSCLHIQGEKIPMQRDTNKERLRISRVYVSETVDIPPNSVNLVKCSLEKNLKNFMVEPTSNKDLLVPRTAHKETTEPLICVINTSNTHRRLKKKKQIGEAQEFEVAFDSILDDPHINKISSSVESSVPKQGIPDHLKILWEQSKKHITAEEQTKLRRLLYEYQDVFARNEFDLGNFTAIEHNIDTGDAKPLKQRMRRTPISFANEEKAHLDKRKAGVIQPSNSEWASAPVLVRKRHGSVRCCVDYCGLNTLTTKDVYPLPLIDECMDTLAGNLWFSKLDANSAYWQVKIREQDRKKTAFITKYGLYEFVRMAFGLCNAPATFSRVMNLVLRGLTWDIVLAFLDDIIVLGKSFTDHLNNIKEVLTRLRSYRLKLKPSKCVLFQKEVEFLGRWVSNTGLSMKEEHTKAVINWPVPKNTHEVEQFLGLVNYHRMFIKDFAEIACPLYGITGKREFKWEIEQQEAFDRIKEALSSVPVLSFPNNKDLFILDTDASDFAIGAELSQVQDGKEKVIAYSSLALSSEQKRYCVTRKELLAVVRFTRQFGHYLLGRHFVIRTDHNSLTWLLRFRDPQGKIARWFEELS